MSSVGIKRKRVLGECDETYHEVGYIYSIKPGACFTVMLNMHIPWPLILNKLGRQVFQQVEIGCQEGDNVLLRPLNSEFVTGHEQWVVHCHCKKPGSLQCLAGGRVMCDLAEEYVYGSLYNEMFPTYRQYVNRGLPNFMQYVGSVYFRGKHLIYVVFRRKDQLRESVEKISFGLHVCISHSRHNILIFCCKSCKTLTEIMACCCMRRTRLLLVKCANILLKSGHPYLYERSEPARQKMLSRLMKYGVPFRYTDFIKRYGDY